MVSFVMSRYGHDGAGPIGCQDIITDPNGQFLLGEGVNGICPSEGSADRLVVHHALALRTLAGLINVVDHCGSLCCSGERFHQRMFGCQHHETHPKKGVWSCGEDGQLLWMTFNVKSHAGTFGSTDPVPLGFLDAVRPIQPFQAIK